MKRFISVLMVAITLLLLPLEVVASSSEEYVVLPELQVQSTQVRTRKQVDGLRLYVDEENPLFMIRNAPVGNMHIPEVAADSAIKTYYALPEDVRNFTVIYMDEGPAYMTPQEQLDYWYALLDILEPAKIPVVLQSECFCTNKQRDPFTQEQLSDFFKKYTTLMGFVQVELSTNGITNKKLAYDEVTDDQGVLKNILARMKSCVKACVENGGLFIWQDMEYIYWQKSNYVNHLLNDRELYDLLKSNSENIIIMDKHNGHGRHFASQANIFGCWLDDVCGNWGVNLENFLWYEEGFIEYDDLGVAPNEPDPITTAKYPPALYGIDMIADAVAGATVYAIEGTFSRGGLYQYVDNDVIMTATFYDVLYPFYQYVLNGSVPNKDQVKDEIKVAYKMTNPIANALMGNDAHLLQGLYCNKFTFWQEKSTIGNIYDNCTKTWVPSTGRYYVVPILPIYSDPEEVLPDAQILNDFNYFFRFMFINSVKVNYFNKHYEEIYTGDGVLFDINDHIYAFNSNENKTIDARQTVNYTLPETQKNINLQLESHTYAIITEDDDKVNIDMCNLRLDTDDVCNGLESEYEFMYKYALGEKRSDPKNFRETTIELSGYSERPTVTAQGTNGAKLKETWDKDTGTLTLSVISNGRVNITVE
ncbi:MAG: hypothetical protein J6L62_04395 [Clostridia bacterium]|nr:hypothetical protein [Clostridia bacterium]